MNLQVETAAGPIGLPEPYAFMLGSRRVKVIKIIDRWLSATHGYFKLKADDGAIYILRHDEHSQQWEMTLFQTTDE